MKSQDHYYMTDRSFNAFTSDQGGFCVPVAKEEVLDMMIKMGNPWVSQAFLNEDFGVTITDGLLDLDITGCPENWLNLPCMYNSMTKNQIIAHRDSRMFSAIPA